MLSLVMPIVGVGEIDNELWVRAIKCIKESINQRPKVIRTVTLTGTSTRVIGFPRPSSYCSSEPNLLMRAGVK